MNVDLADVQAPILRSVDPAYAFFGFFCIREPTLFRKFLRSTIEWTSQHSQTGGSIDTRVYCEALLASSNQTPQICTSIAFTFAGLKTLGVDRRTLSTFPEPFREGMAARAHSLGDTGVSAPEHWDGFLGSSQIHGLLWWNLARRSQRADDEQAPTESDAQAGCDSNALAAEIANLLNGNGAELLHLEIGQANYRRFKSGEIGSVEHFGFRDGISQPWIDVGLPPPPAGGGTPRQDGSWAPLAPGEFLLGYPDEDGLIQPWPSNKALRQSGTYMVFRKLEQDVVGFRNFLRATGSGEQGPGRLAAQMMGRWPDGTPVIRSPHGPEDGSDGHINDFRYGREDPQGLRCPIGAHIRRANPRDTGDRDEVRRHRLLRRGIAYGGPLLSEGSPDDGRKRGLLFIALNARIDQQFEFVQTRWMNSGEFVGQVGAGHDPILAHSQGTGAGSSLLPPRSAAATDLARFVTLRGGDYFFLPGLKALLALAQGASFPPQEPPPGDALGNFKTPDPIDLKELARLAQFELLPPGKPSYVAKTIDFQAFEGAPVEKKTIAYVAQHEYVAQVLKDEATYGVEPYRERVGRITGGRQLLIGLPDGSPVRAERRQILLKALRKLHCHYHARDPARYARIGVVCAEFTKTIVDKLLEQVGPRGRLDVVNDLGRVVPVMLAEQLFGIPGPKWVSPTATAARFAQFDMADVPPSWVAKLPSIPEEAKPLYSVQAWARLAFLHVFVNVLNAQEVGKLAEGATTELFQHLDDVIEHARHSPRNNETLLGCLIELGDDPEQFAGMDEATYTNHMRLILAEMTVGGIETVNMALANVVDFALTRRGVLEAFRNAVEARNDEDLDALIREALRFAPVSPVLFRVATRDTKLGENLIAKGSIICLFVQAAMFDPRVFPNPLAFDPARDQRLYLHFGDSQVRAAVPAPHHCVGQDIAVAELRELVKAVVGLNRLRRAAGPAGNKREGLRMVTSLVVRFDPTCSERPRTKAH